MELYALRKKGTKNIFVRGFNENRQITLVDFNPGGSDYPGILMWKYRLDAEAVIQGFKLTDFEVVKLRMIVIEGEW